MESNGILIENIKTPPGPNQTFAPVLINSYSLQDVKFNGHCLINSNTSVFNKSNKKFLHTRYMVKRFKYRFHAR